MSYFVTNPLLEPLIYAQQAGDRAYQEEYQSFMAAWPEEFQNQEFSLSTLQKSPQQSYLARKHRKDMRNNAANSHWSLIGTAIHAALENYPHGVKERRYGYVIKELGCLVHHKSDLILPEQGQYIDYKNVSCGAMKYPKDHWEEQLNFGVWLAENHGWYLHEGKLQKSKFQINEIYVVANLMDWRPHATQDLAVSQEGSVVVSIPKWEPERVVEWFTERARVHLKARKDGPPPCTDEERWKRDGYKVYGYNKGNGLLSKNAATSEIFQSESKAKAWAAEQGKPVEIKKVEGNPLNCLHYCQSAPFCRQHLQENFKG